MNEEQHRGRGDTSWNVQEDGRSLCSGTACRHLWKCFMKEGGSWNVATRLGVLWGLLLLLLLLVIADPLPTCKASVSVCGIKTIVREFLGSHSGYCEIYCLWGGGVLQFGRRLTDHLIST